MPYPMNHRNQLLLIIQLQHLLYSCTHSTYIFPTQCSHNSNLPYNAHLAWPTLSAFAAFKDRTLSPWAAISFNKSSGPVEGVAIVICGVGIDSLAAGGGFFFAGCWGSVGPSALLFCRDKIVVNNPFLNFSYQSPTLLLGRGHNLKIALCMVQQRHWEVARQAEKLDGRGSLVSIRLM